MILSFYTGGYASQIYHLNNSIKRRFISSLIIYKKGALSPATINRFLLTCEIYYRFCFGKSLYEGSTNLKESYYKNGRYDTTGLNYIRRKSDESRLRVKVFEPLIEPLGVDEVNAVIKSARRYRDLSIIYLMLMCGLRSIEIVNLEYKAVHCEEKWLRVRGKRQKERVIPLSSQVIEVLKKYLRLERPQNSKNFFFAVLQGKRKGEPMTSAGIRSLFRALRVKSKIKKANPHRFRHTFGANMAESDVSLPVIQSLMGHSDFETTLKYIVLSPRAVFTAFEKAQAKIRGLYD